MLEFMNITKALADENRVRVLMALHNQELCVCQLIELLQLAPSTVSKHLYILRQARLIEARKDGRWIYYCLVGSEATAEIKGVLTWVHRALKHQPRIVEDGQRLEDILQTAPEMICRQ